MKRLIALAGLTLALGGGTAQAQPVTPAQPFAPGLGEIMTLQQIRHAKLWLAGGASNWPLAGYELDELREGFDDAARLHATHEGVPVAKLIAGLTPAPLDALEKAIAGKNAAQFRTAFDRLSAACNACHMAAKKEFIRIVRPRSSAFPNQEFRPAPK